MQPIANDELMLFALDASRNFGDAIGRELHMALSAHEEREFEDGEHKARSLANVRGRDVYVVQSLHGDARQSVNDKLLRLLFFIGSVKDASAARVTAVVPYLAYSRKDRKTKPRDPVTTRYIAAMFESVGTDCVMTIDVHNLAAFQNAYRCRAENLEANPLFVAHLVPLLRDTEVVVVSPDAGGLKRADALRQRLAAALNRSVGAGFAEKYRIDGAVSGEALMGEVRGKTAVIVDDLISGGNTMAGAARACRSHGAARVIGVATHAVFADTANQVLGECDIERIIVSDIVPPSRVTDSRLHAKLEQVRAAPLFAEAIRRMHAGGSLAELLGD
jgi:ribose-phosphate pyrophosphokinase